MDSYTENKEKGLFPNITLDLVFSALPMPLCIASIIFDAYSHEIIYVIILSLLTGSLLLFARHFGASWKNGKLAGLSVIIGFLVWYSIPASVNLFTHGIPYRDIFPVPIEGVTTIWAVIYLSFFMSSWVLASFIFSRFRLFPPIFLINSGTINPKILSILGLTFCAAGFIPYIFSGLGLNEIISLIYQGRLAIKPWIHWDNLGNVRSPFLYLSHSALVAGASVLWLTTQEKTFSYLIKTFIAFTALIVSIIVFFDHGTRSIIILIFMPVVLVKLLNYNRRLNFKFIIVLFSVSAFAISFMQLQLYVRDNVFESKLFRPDFIKWITLDDTTDYFSETVFSLNIVPSFHNYFHESAIYQFVVSPVPRFMWPSKPASQVIWFYTLHRWGIDIYEGGGNVFPGIVGQYYISWGWVGTIWLGVIIGWISSRVDGYLFQMKNGKCFYFRAVALAMCLWIFLSFRSFSPGLLYPIVFMFILIKFSSVNKYSFL